MLTHEQLLFGYGFGEFSISYIHKLIVQKQTWSASVQVNGPGETTVPKGGRRTSNKGKNQGVRRSPGGRGARGERGREFDSRTVYSLISTFLEAADLVVELEDLGLVVVVLDGQLVVGPF